MREIKREEIKGLRVIMPDDWQTRGVHNARNYGDNLETIRTLDTLTMSKAGLINPVTIRVYMSRSRNASRVYASVWVHVHAKGGWCSHAVSGTGYADGYGYCKQSAAVQAALDSAGIGLSASVDGRGMSEVEKAAAAITRRMGYTGRVWVIG